MTFTLPDRLPKNVEQLAALRRPVCLELEAFKARHAAKQTFSEKDVERLEFLLDSRDQIDAVTSFRLAIHEAGHSVVAALVGGSVDVAEVYPAGVTDRDGRNGYCRYLPANVAVAQHEHLIAAAGVVAECVWEYGRPSNWQVEARLAGSRHDAEFLRRHALTAGVGISEPLRGVAPMVRAGWHAIESLAARLHEHGQIAHTDVVTALGLSNDRNLHSFELANIRAGIRMVSRSLVAVGDTGQTE